MMHVRELVDVAGMVAASGPLVARGDTPPNPRYLEQYWSTSKTRFDNWSRALKTYSTRGLDQSAEAFDQRIELRALLDEIFVSEMLTRVWAAVLAAHDRRNGTRAGEPIAQATLRSHLEARHRALQLLLHGQVFSTRHAVACNRIRRRAERWTDVLVGGLMHLGDVREFAVEPARAVDFAADLAERRGAPGGRQAWRLTLVALNNAFHSGLSPIAANPDENARITASILGCFHSEMYDSTGIFRSLWMTRLAANTSDAQGMISELLQTGPEPRGERLRARRRRI